jgi:hypothetical protein
VGAQGRTFESRTFEIQAHRGNDRATLGRLLGAKPTSVEIDVAVTVDGIPICSHETVASELSACRRRSSVGRGTH